MPPLGPDDSPTVRLEVQTRQATGPPSTRPPSTPKPAPPPSDSPTGTTPATPPTACLTTWPRKRAHHHPPLDGHLQARPGRESRPSPSPISPATSTPPSRTPATSPRPPSSNPTSSPSSATSSTKAPPATASSANPLDTAILDYLRKWYCHGWTWRDLTRDRPSIAIPDDHDVYQGNIWGEAGAPKQGTQEMGGYEMHPTWVNVVHRTQSSHHPDPDDSTTIKQNITVYYSDSLYGRVSFAILADRQFKTGPEGNVPPTGTRGDHVKRPRLRPQHRRPPRPRAAGRPPARLPRAAGRPTGKAPT